MGNAGHDGISEDRAVSWGLPLGPHRDNSLSLSKQLGAWMEGREAQLSRPILAAYSLPETPEFLLCQALKRASHFLELDGLT